MRKFFEKIKNIGNVIKFLSFTSDALSAVVAVYEKHYPKEEVDKTKV